MAAPKGNRNASKGREWREAIRYALAKVGADEEGDEHAHIRGLRKVAQKFVAAAEEGEAWAMKELGDRVDGKAPQGIELSGPDGGEIPMSGTVIFKKVKSDDR